MNESKKILVVEDNDFVRMQIVKFLQDAGFETVESTDGSEALTQIDKTIDFAIVDVRMEPVNGFDFIRTIRSDGLKTPVILVTGDDNPDILSESSKLNVAAVLKKPVQKERLIKTVTRTLHVEK
tara:strand:- start:306 stop:677 length:372 start_codon:yes stop_codon:yes gene_type:complete